MHLSNWDTSRSRPRGETRALFRLLAQLIEKDFHAFSLDHFKRPSINAWSDVAQICQLIGFKKRLPLAHVHFHSSLTTFAQQTCAMTDSREIRKDRSETGSRWHHHQIFVCDDIFKMNRNDQFRE
jgi:hypothetical protein